MKFLTRSFAAASLIVVSLIAILFYTYGRLVVVPYIGFTVKNSTGEITGVHNDNPALQVGDVIEQVNGTPWKIYTQDRDQLLFDNLATDDTVRLVVDRNQQLIAVDWVIPGPTFPLVINRLLTNWVVGLVFWVFGWASFWTIRPRDQRWLILIAFYCLMAVWLVAGAVSSYRFGYGGIVLHALTWLLLILILHFHWLFPRSLGSLPRPVGPVGYTLAGLLAVAEVGRIPPDGLYLGGASLALVGSLVLLIAHAVRQPDTRRDLRLLVIALGMIVLAVIGLSWLAAVIGNPAVAFIYILFFTLIPSTYFYLARRRQTGGMEVRSNQLVSFLFYGLGMIALAALGLWMGIWIGRTPLAELLATAAIILCLGLASTITYPIFRRRFERSVLGVTLPSDELVDTFTRRVAASPDRQQLQDIWQRDILPSLLVRQALLLYFSETDAQGIPCRTEPVVRLGVPDGQLPAAQDLLPLLQTGPAHPPVAGWVRLALPLAYRGRTIGAALFGRRDPDDEYSAALLPILRTLLSQTALALVNTNQADLLHALQRYEIERREEEQRRLSHDLHDEVLGQMTLVAQHVDPDNGPFREAQQAAVQHVRNIIAGLRPSTLSFMGLQPALGELFDELEERAQASGQSDLQLILELEPSETRYPEDVELAVYRIVQQACQNAIKHARAHCLTIRGRLDPGCIELCVEDDGKGFTAFARSELTPMLVHQHFGLLNMYERSDLANAHLQIDSAPGQGTRVKVSWRA